MAMRGADPGEPAGDGGASLFTRDWQPGGAVRARLLVTHGFGEHSGRYAGLAEAMVAAGIAVHAWDHRGHGHSPGQRGHIPRWDVFRADVGRMLAGLRALDNVAVPVFLYGHSMGGLMVLDYGLHGSGPEPAGIIASAPFLYPEALPRWRRLMAAVAARLMPEFGETAGIDARTLSRDPAVVRDYEQDPLVHSRISARLAHEMFTTAARTRRSGHAFRHPLLIVHGEADRLAPATGSERFFAGLGRGDFERRTWPETRHEPHNDLDRDEVLATIEEWLLARIASV